MRDRFKQLKDSYRREKKKEKAYVPSGSAACPTKKPSFRFYEQMKFLGDVNPERM